MSAAPYLLIQGDAAKVLSGPTIGTGAVDMVYCDPPFGNEQVWRGVAGTFSDCWMWDDSSQGKLEALRRHNPSGAAMVEAFPLPTSALAYLVTIAELLMGVRRVLKPTGTLWLHFDDTMGAYLRVVCDVVFGLEAAVGLVIWRRTASHGNASGGFGRVHDTIACYARTPAARWRLWRCKGDCVSGDPIDRDAPVVVSGYTEDRLASTSKERVGYPTQKPVSLLKSLIAGATIPGGVVLDPTCGSGSALVAATALGRRGIGIDVSGDAIRTSAARLAVPKVPVQGDLFAEAAA